MPSGKEAVSLVCKNCHTTISDNSVYCHICGKRQAPQPRRRLHRGKAQGTIIKLPGTRKNPYWARLPVDSSSGASSRKSLGCYPTYSDAAEALAKAMYVPDESGSVQSPITLKEIYDRFLESN